MMPMTGRVIPALCYPCQNRSVVPAKAGTHRSASETFEESVPAFAGTTILSRRWKIVWLVNPRPDLALGGVKEARQDNQEEDHLEPHPVPLFEGGLRRPGEKA